MSNFKVTWFDVYNCPHVSEVYAIDTLRDLFLVTNRYGRFEWVDIENCEIKEDSNE